MLDRQIENLQKPVGALQAKRIMVLGACCAFGRSMSRALSAAGAQVVAADADAQALGQLSDAVPLTLKGAPEEALRRVGRVWGEARLDAVLNLMPLRHPEQIDLNIAVLQGIVQGFMPALSLSGGQILTVVSRPEQPLDVAGGAMAPAILSAQTALAHALRRDGLTLNTVSVGAGVVTPARKTVIGLLSGTLGPLTGSEVRL
ncbi:hypothetical protein [Sulfitobacter guttiformis]|nr:hypothetical protein [Sulfitobacter guttiformis]KIN72857.1 hypothetical protein Z949_2038 [Sulfitobacter guttiformis KCTC 32187]